MEEAMTWILVGIATLGAFALAVLDAWLLLKLILATLARGTAIEGKTQNKRVRT